MNDDKSVYYPVIKMFGSPAKKSVRSITKHSLRFESLENRELLSASNPLYMNANVGTTPYQITDISAANLTSLNNASDVTLLATFKTPQQAGLSDFNYLITHDCSTNQGKELYLRIRDSKFQFGTWNGSNQAVEVSGVQANTWYSLVGVYDWNNTSAALTLYVYDSSGGSSVHTAASSVNIASIQNSTLNPAWYVGRQNPDTSRNFRGTIGSVAIWNEALTVSEIATAMKVSLEVTDGVATERLSSVTQDYGAFKFKRSLAGDLSYAVSVGFEMSRGSNNNTAATYGIDYSLQYQNTNGQWLSLSPTTVTANAHRFSVTIPAYQPEVLLRLVPIFDWLDEAEEFDPFGSGTPKDNAGEWANIELVAAWWTGMGSGWNPLDSDHLTGAIEIKDGAFVSITSDFNNDGSIDNDDYLARHGDVGSLVLLNAEDTVHYYAWIDELGSHTYTLAFQGTDGIYLSNSDTVLSIYQGHNLATGLIDVKGYSNSTGTDTCNLLLSVGGFLEWSDWTRFSVFSVFVDTAFNHDRNDNDGSDGLNIRTDGTADTEHYGAELLSGKVSAADWVTPNGNVGQGTVLYLAGKNVDTANRFSLSLPLNTTLKLQGQTGLSIGGFAESAVTFVNGVSSSATASANNTVLTVKPVSGIGGFVVMTATAQTVGSVKKEQGTINWFVSKIANKGDVSALAYTTPSATVYTILAAPQGPWNVADTAADDKQQPWVTALEFAINTAGTKDKATPAAALAQLTTFLHSGYGLTYRTASNYFGDRYYLTFQLSKFITKQNGNFVNCEDLSVAMVIFGNLLGIAARYQNVQQFGYIKSLNVVGNNIPTNNPGQPAPFTVINEPENLYPLIQHWENNQSSDERTIFGYHAFVVLDGKVFDAVLGCFGEDNLTGYYNKVMDFDANRQKNTKNGNTAPPYPYNAVEVSAPIGRSSILF